MEKAKNEVLTTTEACQYLKISKPTLLKLIYSNQIKAKKVGKGWRLLRSELQAYLGEKETPSKSHIGFDESKASVLVVDDEPEIACVIRDILVWGGFEVEIAESGEQALNLLVSGRRFDLVITDMKMPNMDGLELLGLIRRSRKGLPVIVLTGYPTVENWVQSLREGAADYVFKPFNVEKLMSAVTRAVSESRSNARHVLATP